MYAGQIVEDATLDETFYDPQHPYTWGLLGSLTRLDQPSPARLAQIPGQPPSLLAPPIGLPVRAPLSARVRQVPRAPRTGARAGGNHLDRCWLDPRREEIPADTGDSVSKGDPLLEVTDLVKHFPIKSGIVDRPRGRPGCALSTASA